MPQQARPPKRPSDAGDSPSEGSPGPKVKLPRLERGTGPEHFSSVVKSKLQSYTRTGQACDRCKVRKIRCDAHPGGCGHCRNQGLECLSTDRVTGRTERRGYVHQLESEKNEMLEHIRELHKFLHTNYGVEVRPWEYPNYSVYRVAFDARGNEVPVTQVGPWQKVGALWIKNDGLEKMSRPASAIVHRYESRPTDSYLGVSADRAPLSSIKGTTLSILGTTIDIASFDAPDMDEPPPGTPIGSPLYNKSVMAFLQSILSVNPRPESVDLPSRQDAFTYAEWYFLMVSPFLPILHKPSFLELLTRIYDDTSYKASVAEMVIVHMVFATIYLQYGVRNREEPEKHAQLNEFSNKHYHWSLSKFFDLAISQTTTAVQALAMIVSHTRNFPKPGCSSTIAHFALMKAVELNFHRAVKHPEGQTTLDSEIRKRSFWAILAVMVTLNGRLGRPMPMTSQEFDVDFPIAIPDEYLTEEGITDMSKIGHCDYHVGIMAYKVVPLYIDMFSNIYAVRRDPNKYVEVVYELEARMKQFRDSIPEDLMVEKCKASNQVFALYTQAYIHEFSLCLRHPSVCMTDDPKFCAENTRICEDSAKKLLGVVNALLKVKSLDTTWYQLAVYIAAMFSTLVAHWERRATATADEIATLRADMTLWLNIVAEIGRLMGTGTRLANEVSAIVERTINWIEHDMNHKAGSPTAQGLVKQPPVSPFQQTPVNPKSPSSASPMPTASDAAGDARNPDANGGTFYDPTSGPTGSSYPPLNYGDQVGAPESQQLGSNGVGSAYGSAEAGALMYSSAPSVPAAAVSGINPIEQAAMATNPLIAFASQATQQVGGQGAEDWRHAQLLSQNSGKTWNEWTAAMADSHMQDRYSANALLTLGSSKPSDVGVVGDAATQAEGLAAATSHASQWPLLLFHEPSP